MSCDTGVMIMFFKINCVVLTITILFAPESSIISSISSFSSKLAFGIANSGMINVNSETVMVPQLLAVKSLPPE